MAPIGAEYFRTRHSFAKITAPIPTPKRRSGIYTPAKRRIRGVVVGI